MIRLDSYCIYEGNEYIISKLDDGMYKLISRNKNDLNRGFKETFPKVYVKIVSLKEITSAYSVSTFCKYKGYRFQIVREKDEKILIHTGDYNLYQQLDLDFVEKGAYDKWVDRDEIEELWEEKEGIYGFTV